MENKIETVVEGTEAMSVATHAGLKKGAVILGVAGVVGVVGFIATKFVIKPVIKKIKAKKASKKAMLNAPERVFDFDDELDHDILNLFPDEDDEEDSKEKEVK